MTAPRKHWKLTDMHLKSYSRWCDYSWACDTDGKVRGRLNIIRHLLTRVPYEPIADREINLPNRQKQGDYRDPRLPVRPIPTPL